MASPYEELIQNLLRGLGLGPKDLATQAGLADVPRPGPLDPSGIYPGRVEDIISSHRAESVTPEQWQAARKVQDATGAFLPVKMNYQKFMASAPRSTNVEDVRNQAPLEAWLKENFDLRTADNAPKPAIAEDNKPDLPVLRKGEGKPQFFTSTTQDIRPPAQGSPLSVFSPSIQLPPITFGKPEPQELATLRGTSTRPQTTQPGTATPPRPPGAIPASRQQTAATVVSTLRAAGASDNAIAGILQNIRSESNFDPANRHFDQPRFRGTEAENSHGLYQEGGTNWNRYDKWLKGRDWRDPQLQTQFLAENLKTNYPKVWESMQRGTKEQAAQVFVKDYLRPASQHLNRRFAEYGRGVPGIDTYTGGVQMAAQAAPAIPSGQPAAPAAPAPGPTLGNLPVTPALVEPSLAGLEWPTVSAQATPAAPTPPVQTAEAFPTLMPPASEPLPAPATPAPSLPPIPTAQVAAPSEMAVQAGIMDIPKPESAAVTAWLHGTDTTPPAATAPPAPLVEPPPPQTFNTALAPQPAAPPAPSLIPNPPPAPVMTAAAPAPTPTPAPSTPAGPTGGNFLSGFGKLLGGFATAMTPPKQPATPQVIPGQYELPTVSQPITPTFDMLFAQQQQQQPGFDKLLDPKGLFLGLA